MKPYLKQRVTVAEYEMEDIMPPGEGYYLAFAVVQRGNQYWQLIWAPFA